MSELIIQEKKEHSDVFYKRIHEIDLIRGFLIILVVIDHLMWAFSYYTKIWWGESNWLYIASNWYYRGDARGVIQPMALMAFCFVSGVSCAFSRSNKKRALLMLIFWAIIALGSNILSLIFSSNGINVEIRVDLNIIGVLAFSTFIYCLIEKRSWKILLVAILISFLLSQYLSPLLRESLVNVFGGYTNNRTGVNYGINGTPKFYMPLFWEYPEMADFVPLFPYLIAFLSGALFSYFFYKQKKMSLFPNRKEWERPICFLGRHTLIIYLAHYIVIRGIFIIINLIMTGSFA